MTLFIRKSCLGLLISICSSILSFGQNCTNFPVFFPDTVCQGQVVRGVNQGPANFTYEWDYCGGDLFRSGATSTQIPVTGLSGVQLYGFKMVQNAGKFYGFSVSNSTSALVRFNFDTNANSNPTPLNLGNPGGNLSTPSGIEIQKHNNIFYGFSVNRGANQIVRFTFIDGIDSPPISDIIPVPLLNNAYGIKLVKEGNTWYGFGISGGTPTSLVTLNFGNSLSSTPVVGAIPVPSASYLGMTIAEDCSGKYLFMGDNAGKIQKVNFGSSYGNSTPEIVSFNYTPTFSGNPGCMAAVQEGGRSLIVMLGGNGGGFGILNFGSSYKTNSPGVILSIPGVPSGAYGVSEVLYTNAKNPFFIFSGASGFIGKIAFPIVNCSFTSVPTGYNPPSISWTQPGKYFINYFVKDQNGNTIQGGDTVVVKSGTAQNAQVPFADFVADEQCPSAQTKFYPTVTPAGTYSYFWTFPIGGGSTLVNPSRNFPVQGNYPVTLRVRSSDGCGVNSITRLIKIFPNPSAAIVSDFTVPVQICTKDSVLFSDGSSPSNLAKRWKWNFGNGQIVFSKDAKAYYPFSFGNQPTQVSLVASDSSGCGTPVSKSVTPKPGADIIFSVSKICKGEITQFQNSTPNPGAANFLWNFGNPSGGSGNTSTSGAPLVTYTYPDSGLYNVSLRGITTNGCTSLVSTPVRIYPIPKADFSFPSATFPNQPIPFLNSSSAMSQTITQNDWIFGEPASGVNNTSNLKNPTHTYASIGQYEVQLRISTNQSCTSSVSKQLPIYPPCPIVTYTKQASASGNFDTLNVNNQTQLVRETRIDFCAGDLALNPVLQSQQTGTSPIQNANQIIPIKDNGKWIGFIPAPTASNATCFFKSNFGSTLNNDVQNFATGLGSLQNRFPNPAFIRFYQEDTVWYGIASNGDAKLWRIRFGASIDNNSPIVTEIPVPTGTFVTPSSAQIFKDKDTTYILVTNNNVNAATNNLVRLRFKNSILDTPSVSFLNHPVLQNSNGFVNASVIRNCDKWFALVLGKSQLYRLSFGNSLNNTPTVVSITSEVTAGLPSANAFDNLRGITLLQDLGKWYGLINTSTGNLIRIRFSNGVNQSIDNVSPLGNFGIVGTVGPMSFLQDGTEVFGLTINTQGTVYKIKFPNQCPASNPFVSQSIGGNATTTYGTSGKYYITITSETSYGATTQRVDSVLLGSQNLIKKCNNMPLNHPQELCFNNKYTASTGVSNLRDVKWDFCTGDFKLLPEVMGTPFLTNAAGAGGVQIVQQNNIYYAFVANPNGMTRIKIGEQPNLQPSAPVQLTLPGGGAAFGSLHDFKFFKEGNDWFALCIYLTGESVVRLNFGPDITKNDPSFTVISLPGFISKSRGIDLFEDGNNKYAIISNQTSGNLTILNFGSGYRNIPSPTSIDIPGAINIYKVSMIQDCNIWHAFLTDQSQDSIYQLTFTKGLENDPIIKTHRMIYAIGVQAIKDGNEFFLFATKTQTNVNNLFRFSFGNSLSNTPKLDSLGNFQSGTTSVSGLTRVFAFQIYKNTLSENLFFGLGFDNGNLYRIRFKNPCSAAKPVAEGDTVSLQSFGEDGKYYISSNGYDPFGNLVTGFDSVTVKNLVEALFTVPGNRCKGEPISFLDGSIPGTFTNITSWKWSFGDTSNLGDSSTLQNPNYTFPAAGSYNVKLTVKEEGGCVNEIIKNIAVADKPKPNFSFGNSTLICTNDSIQFTDLSQTTNDPIIFRNWEIKKDNITLFTTSRQNPKFLFTQTGSYSATLTIKGQSQCDSTISKTFQVGSIGPLVSFTNTKACLNEAVTFTAQISGTSVDSLNWYIDNVNVTGLNSFNNTFTSTNSFTVLLVAHNGGCTNSFTKVINVNTRPSFSINSQAPLFCQGLPINFSTSLNSSENLTYKWNFGDGTSDTIRTPVKTFNSSGSFLVSLKITTENGCDSKDSVLFVAKRAPKAEFKFDKACKDEPVTFTNLSTANGIPNGITSYFWEFGNLIGQTSTQRDPGQIFYNETEGTKTVKLTVRTEEDCPNTYTLSFVIGSKLAANYRIETGCIGTPFRFSDKSDVGLDSIISWNWSIGGLNYNIRNPIVEFDQKGIYDVRLAVTSKSGCFDEIIRTDDFLVLDSAKADFTISTTTFAEPPYKVTFSQVPEVNPSYDYVWDFGDSTSSTSGNPPPHFYEKEGTYLVRLTAVRTGTICSTEVVKVVNVITNPLEGLKLRKLFVGQGVEKTSIAVEVENQSNVALRSFDISVQLGNLVNLKETWSGILFPGAFTTYNFKSSILSQWSQNVPYICATVSLPNPAKEISPNDNNQCLSTDSVPAIISLFPNPAKSDLNIDLNLPTTDPFELKLVNSIGQNMIDFKLEQPQPGAFRQRFDVSRFPHGVYNLRFRSGKVVENRTLMIQKE